MADLVQIAMVTLSMQTASQSKNNEEMLNIFIPLCAALALFISTTAHALELVEVKTTTGCELTVVATRVASTYMWDGECIAGKAEGLGTFVQKVRVDDN